jgi:hypothetical protein
MIEQVASTTWPSVVSPVASRAFNFGSAIAKLISVLSLPGAQHPLPDEEIVGGEDSWRPKLFQFPCL